MSDAVDHGITVTEIPSMDQSIDASLETTAAFVGRALRGPLNTPILIKSVVAFHRRFGGVWAGSSLGTAVVQFFEHGGKQLYIVRVANGARGAMLCIPAVRGMLILRAVEPGSSEDLRAAVDYDGLPDEDTTHFNLTLQRVSGNDRRIIDQEIYRELSCEAADDRCVEDVLQTSAHVRIHGPLPAARPIATETEYIELAQPGTDGLPLCDYDFVGSSGAGTGLFALDQVDRFELLYFPPPERGRVPGPAAILAAELYCHKRGAMLIVDPPDDWKSAADAVRGVRNGVYANPDVLTYFPRVYPRRDDGCPPLAVGGAIAGLLCKLDRLHGPWEYLDQAGITLSRKYVPAMDIGVAAAHLLVKEGLNVIAGSAPGHTMVCGGVTLAHGTQVGAEFSTLATRRLCLCITNAIDRATRWAVFEADAARVGERIVGKVHAFMCAMADAGAFQDDHFLVQCDALPQGQPVDPIRGITLLLAFHPAGSRQTVSLTVHQTVSGCRVVSTAFAPVRAECA